MRTTTRECRKGRCDVRSGVETRRREATMVPGWLRIRDARWRRSTWISTTAISGAAESSIPRSRWGDSLKMVGRSSLSSLSPLFSSNYGEEKNYEITSSNSALLEGEFFVFSVGILSDLDGASGLESVASRRVAYSGAIGGRIGRRGGARVYYQEGGRRTLLVASIHPSPRRADSFRLLLLLHLLSLSFRRGGIRKVREGGGERKR